MLFFPKGPANGDVVDPDKTSRDFIEADRISSHTTHWQWTENSIDNTEWLERGTHADVVSASIQADLGNTSGAEATLTDSDLYVLSFNNGYQDVSNMELTWSSIYPELVMLVFSFQYIRHRVTAGTAGTAELKLDSGFTEVRFTVRIKVNGVLQEGAGIYQSSEQGSVRGTGYSHRSLAGTVTVVTMLPAGTNTIVPVASLTDSTVITATNNELKRNSGDFPPTSGCVIGNREMIAMRFARGMWMGG